MSRSSFFSNMSADGDFTQPISSPVSNNSSKPTPSPQSEEMTAVRSSKSKRLTYSIKIDPAIRQEIKDWATHHDVTISSVIETLARNHLKDLSVDDIQP